MNESSVRDIAIKLAKLYLAKADLELREWQLNQDLAERELALTPLEGWPGKNAEQREVERNRTMAGDIYTAKLRRELYEVHSTLMLTAGQIQSLETERRGQEWRIREQLVKALSGQVEPAQVEAQAFDAAADLAVDRSIFDLDLPALSLDGAGSEEKQILAQLGFGL